MTQQERNGILIITRMTKKKMNGYGQEYERGKKMANEEKLKNVIREEMERVMKMLIDGGSTDAIIITKWLQSLQRINDVCKERNRY